MANKEKNRDTWRVELKLGSKRHRKRGFVSKKHAELYEKQIRLDYERGLLNLKKKDCAIEKVFTLYLESSQSRKRKKTFYREITSVNNWKAFFQEKKIVQCSELNQATIEQFIFYRKSKSISVLSMRTLEIDIQTMIRIINFGASMGLIEPVNLSKKQYHARQIYHPRILKKEEIEQIEDRAKRDTKKTLFYEIFAVLVRTGMRSGELCSLKKENCDFVKNQIVLFPHQTKANKQRRIPMVPLVNQILSEQCQKANDNGFIFVSKNGNQIDPSHINRRFRHLLNKSSITNSQEIHIHCLRATFISHSLMSGVQPEKIMAWVGHEDYATFKRYLSLPDSFLEEKRDFLGY